MQNSKNLKCHSITSFPKPFCPDKTPYNKTDFASSVRVSCLSISSVLTGLRMCKVIVLGDVNVGKTSIVNRFCRQIFNLNYKATIGVDFEVEQFDILKVPFNMQIWDTAGQERFRCIAAAYYRSAHVIVTVFDLTSIKSLHHCVAWMNEALSSNIETPLKFLVGTKMDLVSDVTYAQVENEATKVAKVLGSEYWAVSARTGEGVTELFHRIAALSFEQIIKSELETPDTRHRIKLGENLLVKTTNGDLKYIAVFEFSKVLQEKVKPIKRVVNPQSVTVYLYNSEVTKGTGNESGNLRQRDLDSFEISPTDGFIFASHLLA